MCTYCYWSSFYGEEENNAKPMLLKLNLLKIDSPSDYYFYDNVAVFADVLWSVYDVSDYGGGGGGGVG